MLLSKLYNIINAVYLRKFREIEHMIPFELKQIRAK